MRLVVGLGNPGRKYERTRHNIGFEVLRELSVRHSAPQANNKHDAELTEIFVDARKILLAAPTTFMNLSGQSVQKLVKFHQVELEDILVICDDMNLPLGKLRFRASGSAGGQNGLKDIIQKLGSDVIPRLRIGIDRPPERVKPSDYVLGKFFPEQKEHVERVVKYAADAVEAWHTEGLTPAMNRFNAMTIE